MLEDVDEVAAADEVELADGDADEDHPAHAEDDPGAAAAEVANDIKMPADIRLES